MAVGLTSCQGRVAALARSRLIPLMAKGDEERAKRLAEALRQNLRRRKAQARGTELAEPAEDDGARKEDDQKDSERT